MKKIMIAVLSVMMAAGLCVSAAAETELVVFAAASMTETLTEIKALYEEATAKLSSNHDADADIYEPDDTIPTDDPDISESQEESNSEDISAGKDLRSQISDAEYSYENGIGSTYHFITVKNDSEVTIKLDANVIAKDKDGNTIGAYTPSARAIAPGQDALLTSLFSDVVGVASFEYSLTVNEDLDHISAYPDIQMDLSYTDTKVIVSGTNVGNDLLKFPEVTALFFLNGTLVGHNSTYLVNGDNELPSGATIAKEISCIDSTYDDVMIFLRGDKE